MSHEEDIHMIDLFEEYLNEALKLLLAEEEAEEPFCFSVNKNPDGSFSATPVAFTKQQEAKQGSIASLERARYVWLLRGSLLQLAKLGQASGWLTRSTKDWYSLLFFSCFASLPTSGNTIENCPTYPAHRMLKTAQTILAEPNNYHPLLAAFRYQQMVQTGRKR